MEVWEKVILSDEAYFENIHGEMNCIGCHGGVSGTDDKEAAHEGMVREPDSREACDICHVKTRSDATSLHTTLRGYITTLKARSDTDTWPTVEKAYEAQCTECHTTCGQCHVSRPTSLGGGLLAAHAYKKIPPMNLACTGCHGSRVENEYKGKNEGIPGDTHWTKEGMPCFDCHTAEEMHGTGPDENHRYDGPQRPSCSETGLGKECHADVKPGDGVEQHDETHLSAMSCETCHAVAYKHCYNCHVYESEEGEPYFKSEPSQLMLKIGRNLRKSPERPWDYVLVRHVPVARDTFAFYGDDLLPNFDTRPTWVYATPHNSQRKTPQNESCNACHGNPEVFLTADDVASDELEANKDVIVTEIPAAVGK